MSALKKATNAIYMRNNEHSNQRWHPGKSVESVSSNRGTVDLLRCEALQNLLV